MSVNVQHIEAVQIAFGALLTSLTPAQMESFTENLRASSRGVPQVTTPASTTELNGYGTMMVRTRNVDIVERGALLEKKKKQVKMAKGKLRPLNAFMAFRSYYSPQFAGMTQKARSGIIRKLWEHDEWKHVWTLAAKAYSELRDVNVGTITLVSFLKSIIGILQVIPADDYLRVMGWEMVPGADGLHYLCKTTDAASKISMPLTANLSVEDIKEHCYKLGLVPRTAPTTQPTTRPTQSITLVSMAFAGAPNNPPLNPAGVMPRARENIAADMRVSDDLSQKAAFPSVGTSAEDVEFEFNTAVESPAFHVDPELPVDYNPSIQIITADQQQALEALPDRYPYTLRFHPATEPAIALDSNIIRDDFDPFNLSDYVNFDLVTDFIKSEK